MSLEKFISTRIPALTGLSLKRIKELAFKKEMEVLDDHLGLSKDETAEEEDEEEEIGKNVHPVSGERKENAQPGM